MYSYWERKYWLDKYDFIVIGAGIVGLSTALELRKKYPIARILILERGQLPSGASTKNAGFACFGTVSEIIDDLSSSTEEEVINLIKLRWEGLKLLKERIPEKRMDLQNYGGFEIFKDKSKYEEYYSKVDYVNQLIEAAIGHKNVIENIDQVFSKGFYSQCFSNRLESQLNPVLLIKYLIECCRTNQIEIQFSSEVDQFFKQNDAWKIHLRNKLEVDSKQLILCTNAFTKKLIEVSDVVPSRNQVLISKPIKDFKLKGTFHFNKGYTYFRNFDDRLLIGGARDIDKIKEQTDQIGENQKILDHLIAFANRYILEQPMEVDQVWSGIIATGRNKNVIVKQKDEGLYLGVKLGGMGVAIGSAIARQLVALI